MFELWKKYLLNSAVRFAAADEGNGAGGNDAGSSEGEAGGAETEGADGAEGAEGGTDENAEGGDEGDDEGGDPFAGLSAEQRAKIEKRIERETGWRDRQIDRLHRQKRTAQEDNKTLTAIADRQPRAGAEAGDPPLAKEQVEKRAAELAQQMTAQERYNQGLADADEAGRRAYDKDWKAATDRLAKLGGVSVEDMQAILTTDNPAVVLHALADPEEYERVMGLSGAKRNNAFVKIGLKEPPKRGATELKEDLRPGNGSRPVRPIAGARGTAAAAVNIYDDKVGDDAWYEERNRQRRKKFTDAS